MISLGIEELDSKLGGGIPEKSMILITGEHGSGKTVLTGLIVVSVATSLGGRVLVFTNEKRNKDYVRKLNDAGITQFRRLFISGRIIVFSTQIPRAKLDSYNVSMMLRVLERYIVDSANNYVAISIDPLTEFIRYSSEDVFNEFINSIRAICDSGKIAVVTLGNIDDQGLRKPITRLMESSDIILSLSNATVGSRGVKVIRIVKTAHGVYKSAGEIYFEIDPAIGIRIVPFQFSQ